MDGLEALASRPVIITGAIAGALIATLGPFILRRVGIQSRRVLSTVARFGHVLSWISVGLFIAAGFLSKY
ncbi:MAG TPA: hypothetical protein DCE12_06525 [Gammaproteobacteria bacterium]|jgi:hypothetical protein|nr:hypothetical protein [Gammaproteobacteria bacterium]|tara:strand:- start:1302 stop:1511 length:210 start_codon:yes stop_codon:yes gene_type:complete